LNLQIWSAAILIASLNLQGGLYGYNRLPKPISDKIVDFSLFNFDNLIADHYEGTDSYTAQLAHLLSQATQFPTANFVQLVQDKDLVTETMPVKYMVKINLKVRELTGFYFVDD
jgi:hypothetical protein